MCSWLLLTGYYVTHIAAGGTVFGFLLLVFVVDVHSYIVYRFVAVERTALAHYVLFQSGVSVLMTLLVLVGAQALAVCALLLKLGLGVAALVTQAVYTLLSVPQLYMYVTQAYFLLAAVTYYVAALVAPQCT